MVGPPCLLVTVGMTPEYGRRHNLHAVVDSLDTVTGRVSFAQQASENQLSLSRVCSMIGRHSRAAQWRVKTNSRLSTKHVISWYTSSVATRRC